MNFMRRACPLCQKVQPAKMEVRAEMPAEDHTFDMLEKHWHGFFGRTKPFFSYWRCSSCELLFSPTFFTPSQLERLYSTMPDNTAGVPEGVLSRTQFGYFKTFRASLSRAGGDYLEIGPDIGTFSRLVATTMAFRKHWLFEPNRSVHAQLRKAMDGTDYEIRTDLFDYGCVPNNTVRGLVMIHLLDHVLEPHTMLTELRKKLTADARVVIVTHDESSLLPRLVGGRWPAYCLQHPQLYSPTSIARLLQSCGYERITTKKTVNYFPVTYLLKHFMWLFRIRIPDALTLSWPQLPLKLGNIVTVARPV